MSDGPLSHQVISASAGSGKTFQLANRYIALLAGGVDPSRIVALTFTRKAAGEILDKILGRLAEAAASEAAAAGLVGQLAEAGYGEAGQGLDRRGVLRLLRRLLENLHVARLGTLDSFFVSIIRAFPFEFGMGGSLDILDEYAEALAIDEALLAVLTGATSAEDQQELMEQFKQATFGEERRSFAESLREFVSHYHHLYLEAPDPALWGMPGRIWPQGALWHLLTEETRQEMVAAVTQAAAGLGLQDRQWSKLQAFCADALRFEAATPLSKPLKDLLAKLLPVLPDLSTTGATITLYKKLEVPVALGRPLAALASHVVAATLAAHCARTQGIARLVAAYEKVYGETCRATGRLTFGDVQFLLSQGHRGTGPLLSSRAGPDLLYIDYRLDGTFDHWLLDEFQDTSSTQWLALRNLADEVLQRRDGSRTLFYVGDTKQAIYGWRGGDQELFHRILESYNSSDVEPLLQVNSLATSWRSSPRVIEGVNQVFENLEKTGLSRPVMAMWQRSWQTHRAEQTELPGTVALYRIDPPKPASKDPKWEVVSHILEEQKPWERGLRAAVLVRSGKAGRELLQWLRQRGIPVLWEGDQAITDSPAVRAFFSRLRYAAHPGDTYAARHLEMLPDGVAGTNRDGRVVPDTMALLDDLVTRGFEAAVRHFIERCDKADILAEFDRHRLEQLAVAAAAFDRTGERRVLRFIDYATAYGFGESGSADAVRIMSIHKSKGLEFDLVILPDLEGHQSITLPRLERIALSRRQNLTRDPEWALTLPPRMILTGDEVLRRFFDEQATSECYEELCLLYVGMTRARQGLYMVTMADRKGSNTIHLGTLLNRSLDGLCEPRPLTLDHGTGVALYIQGEEDWWKQHEPCAAEMPARLLTATAAPVGEALRPRYQRRTPSGEEDERLNAGQLFSPRKRDAAELGTAVHLLFEQVEWVDDLDPAQAEATARASLDAPEAVWNEALRQFRLTLATAKAEQALRTPGEDAEVWRERNFEMLLDDRWVSGCFDRVTIHRNSAGKPLRAAILDYKTSLVDPPERLAEAIARYRPQLQLYKAVLERLLQLPAVDIATQLLFTRTGEVVTLS